MIRTRRDRIALRAEIAVGLVALLLSAGCGGPAVTTEPLTPSELDQIAAELDAVKRPLVALRCAGSGLLSTEDHRTPFAFAAVFDAPGWLRADIRPSSPAIPSGFTAQLLVENQCARLLFPASLVMVSDCVDDLRLAEPALLLFGVAHGDDLRRLDSPTLKHDRLLRVAGRSGERDFEFWIDPDTGVLTRFDVRGEDDTWLTIEYEGHGWKESLPLPRTTIVRFGRKGRTRARVRFDFDRLRSVEPIERAAHDIIAPPGTTVSGWEDLALWR